MLHPMHAQTPKQKIQPFKSRRALLICIAAILLILPCAEAGVSLVTLVSFNGTNGVSPQGGLVQDSAGSFYGATSGGGAFTNLSGLGLGTIFKLATNGTLTTLVSFDGTNGASPEGGLTKTVDGYIYGTTYNGGSNNAGTIFQVATNGTLTTMVTLAFSDGTGAYPKAGLIQGQDGSLYGTTAFDGTNSGGTAFQAMTNGALATLVSFDFNDSNGASPYAGLVQVNDGSLYGTTYQGGTNGYGTIFKLTTNGTFTSLHSFTGANDGANPYAGLVQGQDGNLYGTTFFGGAYGYGTAFSLATNGVLTTLISFDNTNGAYPQGGLVQDSGGSFFYGTTSAGGAYTNLSGGLGTIFKLETNGTLTTLVSFDGTNGASPRAGLTKTADGNFYGTTAKGGTNDCGTVFLLTVIVSPPKFQTVTRAGAALTLTWSATPGESYQMLFKTNFTQAVWNNLSNSLIATNPLMTTFDVIGPDRQRFYRILLLP